MRLEFWKTIAVMPILKNTSYEPDLIFKNCHVNTVYRTFFGKNGQLFKRKRLELPDHDFIDLDISSVNSKKVVIAIHGLEGSSRSSYIQSLTNVLNNNGYDVVAMNLRSCSGVLNRLISSYHSGKTEDLNSVIQYLNQHYHYDEIHIVGYSLGGNLVFKYMGENGSQIPANIQSAIGVSVPCDLKASAVKMNTLSNRPYLTMFMRSLRNKAIQKLKEHPDSFLTKEAIISTKDFKDFDDVYTAPAHGFKNAEDYWARSSAIKYLGSIKTPTLLITALDDPFFSKDCYPFKEAAENSCFFMEATPHGGHVGFNTTFNVNHNNWHENRIVGFLTKQE